MFPVTIPALTTIVDRQFKEDKALCPVRALSYFLDRTKDLRGSIPTLYFLQERTYLRHQTRYSLSSWLKQTILLCYKQAEQQSLVQVKVHEIWPFVASKAFFGGV